MKDVNASTQDAPLVSIVVINHNQGHVLEEAIESAIRQQYPNKEIIVIDDGSTDDSSHVISWYGDSILPVFQNHGGQAAAYNTGMEISRGDWVCFLDASDLLHPSALQELIPMTEVRPNISRLQWQLHTIDDKGRRTGRLLPKAHPPQGNLRERALEEGPLYDWHFTPPSSGNLWSRAFLHQVFPMPEPPYQNHADSYLVTLAPIFGRVLTSARPLGEHRSSDHDELSSSRLEDEWIVDYLQRFDANCRFLQHHLKMQGYDSNPESWRERNFNHLWPRRLLRAKNHIRRVIPTGSDYLLINHQDWGSAEPVPGRKAIPFPNQQGTAVDENERTELLELNRLQRVGAKYVVFCWTAFSWLQGYPEIESHLRERYPCLVDDESVLIFQTEATPVSEPTVITFVDQLQLAKQA